jgi:hypothetical protein
LSISSLQKVDVSNNFLSGVLLFVPSFKLIGIETNPDLLLPIVLATVIESPTEIPDPSQNINESIISLPLIIGISASDLFILLIIIVVAILFKRREQGKETEIELRLLPKYSSPNN